MILVQSFRWGIFLSCLFLVACHKDEIPVPAHDPGNVMTQTVDMGSDYKWQIYYDLGTNTVVGKNAKTSWDLGFETSADGFHVVLNTAKSMLVWNTGTTNFASVTDTNGFNLNKRWDEASGNLDSTAIGDWRTTQPVYIVNRGYSEMGVHQGFRKIQLMAVDNTHYELRLANLNGTNDVTLTVPKDSTYNLSFVSFAGTGSVVMVEPPKKDWDLVFTQYTHIFYEEDPVLPYLVTGCLLNRYKTKAVMETGIGFALVDYALAVSKTLSPAINTIGYNWKDFTGSVFITRPDKNYIIQDAGGVYYKLHFIDFYNTSGIKGNPKWEFQQL